MTQKEVYPRSLAIADGEIELRFMARGDEGRVLTFARALPPHDLLFMRRNISELKVVEAWANEAATDNLTTLLAIRGQSVVGCVAIVRDELSWSPHVGELRLVVASQMRGKGLGRALTQESIAFREHVKDVNGVKHDVVMLSHDIKRYLERMQTFGAVAPD